MYFEFRRRANIIILGTFISSFLYFYSRSANEQSQQQPGPARDFYKTKYILAWNAYWGDATFGPPGTARFVDKGCPVSNCFVTSDRRLLRSEADYDAILFHHHQFSFHSDAPDPGTRSQHQRYAGVNIFSYSRRR